MTYEIQKSRAAELFGLRPSKASICPRVVAGKRCVRYYRDSGCICERHYKLFDHGRIWLDKNGRHVLTGAPYGATDKELAELDADMRELGLSVSFPNQWLWNPRTLTIMVTREHA